MEGTGRVDLESKSSFAQGKAEAMPADKECDTRQQLHQLKLSGLKPLQ